MFVYIISGQRLGHSWDLALKQAKEVVGMVEFGKKDLSKIRKTILNLSNKYPKWFIQDSNFDKTKV